MLPTQSHGTRDEPQASTPQARAGEPSTERSRTWHVPAAMNRPTTRRRFCAAMYDYYLNPQYWEAF